MDNADPLYSRFQAAVCAYGDVCSAEPQVWHRADVAEFTELDRLLRPPAESGDVLCQYALATIVWLGLRCDSEEQFAESRPRAAEEATRWWIAAAMQGYWPALDNLVTSGVGTEAQRAREAFRQLERERPDLVGASHGMPVYGPAFMQELSGRFYGRVSPDSA